MRHPSDPDRPEDPAAQEEGLSLLWDWPTRVLHWAMAALFLGAFSIAVASSEHGTVFPVHAAVGLLLALAILVRIAWGFAGSRPSRFASFQVRPSSLVRYLKEALAGQDPPARGHNPAASYAAYAMLLLPLALVATGIAMGRGGKWAEEIHGVLAFTMVAVIALHVLGLAWHTHRHREAIALSMVHGRRRLPQRDAIPSSRPFIGVAILLALAGGGTLLWRGLDTHKRTLRLPGLATPLSVGENEKARQGLEHHGDDDGHPSASIRNE
jgi:cytochrome b